MVGIQNIEIILIIFEVLLNFELIKVDVIAILVNTLSAKVVCNSY